MARRPPPTKGPPRSARRRVVGGAPSPDKPTPAPAGSPPSGGPAAGTGLTATLNPAAGADGPIGPTNANTPPPVAGTAPTFAAGGLNTGALNSQALNEGEPPLSLKVAEGSAADPTIVSSPLVVTDRLEIREGHIGSIRLAEVTAPPVSKAVALVQLHSLIDAFQEVGDYNPARHHNTPRPALWIDNADYLKDVQALLQELRRLNDLLAANKPDQESAAKLAALVPKMIENVCLSAATVVGAGIGTVILASAFAVLSHFGAGQEVLQHIPLVPKGK
jgi:hypothetical protein